MRVEVLVPFLAFLQLQIVHALVRPRAPVRAPYHRPNEDALVLNEYGVLLREGYTYPQHFEFIGMHLAQNASMYHELTSINGYRARLDEYTVHELIRYDPGVVRSWSFFSNHSSLGKEFRSRNRVVTR